MKNQGFILKNLLTLMLVCASMNIGAQRVINLNDENAGLKLRATTATAIPQEVLKEAKTARTFALNPALQKANRVYVGDVVNLQLFDDCNYTATVNNIATDVNGNFTLTLKLPDYPFAFAIITTNTEGKSLVTISIPEHGRSFGSRYGINSDANYLIEIDESKVERPLMGDDAIPIPKETGIVELDENGNPKKTPQLRSTQAVNCGPVAKENPNTAATIDLLIVYTPAAATSSYASSCGGINNVISTMIALGNTCLSNSLAGIALRLAHSAQVNYTEPEPHDMQTTLHRLQNPSDGYLDNVYTLRKQYNADLVQMITVESNSGGIGYLLSQSTGSLNYGFSVVYVTQVGGTYPCSVHEMGHNMGLGHAATMINKSSGIFTYSYGWTWNGTTYVNYGGQNTRKKGSVMSYWSGSNYADGINAVPVPYFANPSVNYDGGATGDATQADAARSLREMKHVIAYYSNKIANMPVAPTNVLVSNPTNNGATFSWNAVPTATEYRVIGPTGSYYTTSNTTFTVNSSTWYPATCTNYEFSIQAVNECGDAGDKYTSTFRTFCPTTDPTVVTQAATNMTTTTATLNKTVTPKSDPIIAEGFKYKASTSSTWLTSTSGILTGLTESTTYQFYAYATTATNTFLGSTLSFTTPACDISAPTNIVVSNPTNNGATFSWDAVPNAVSYRVAGPSGSYYTTTNTTYTVNNATWYPSTCTTYDISIRAVAECGEVKSTTQTFRTFCPTTDPTVVTQAATNMTTTSATLNKTVTPKSDAVIAEGFKYKASASSTWLTSTTGILTGLTASTTYQFYAYATTAANTFLGSTLTFTTLACDVSAPTNIIVSTPTDNGITLSWDAAPGAVSYRVCSGSSCYINITNTTNYTVNSSTWYPSACTTYNIYVRAVGECGEIVSSPAITFKTKCATDPTVTTTAAGNITHNSATLNKTVTENGATVTSQGFWYREVSSTSWQTNTTGSLTGLKSNTQYQFYAYATTASETFSGKIMTFKTLVCVAPTVVTQAATNITCNSATLNKLITVGSETIIEQGYEYKILEEENWQTSITGNLTGLVANATYEFRAYASTESGITYGDILTFTATATHTQTIDFPEIAEQTYGDEEITLLMETDAGLTISYESSNPEVASISGNILTITGVGEATITATQEGDCDYIAATPVSCTLTVNKAPLTITAENKIRLKNQENPEFTLSYDGFKNDETESVLDVLPEIFCEADENSLPGIYDIVLSGGSDKNYQYILVDGHLEVIDPVGIDELVAKQLQIFPNPVKDELTIDNGQLIIEDIKIVDLAGKIIDNCQLSIVNSINVSTLQRGVYLLKIYTDKGLIVKRIVKN